MSRRLLFILLILSLTHFVFAKAEDAPPPREGGFVDVHMHLDGSISSPPQGRQTPSFPPGMPNAMRRRVMEMQKEKMKRARGKAKDYAPSAGALVALMDQYGVEKAIVMPPPQHPGQKGAYSYHEILDALKKYPDRLVLGGGGGELNPLIAGTDPSEVTESIRTRFKEQAEQIVRDGAHVFGEMTAMHLCMSPTHHYEAPAPDHPLFLLLADLAAQYDIAIDLHMEAIAEEMPTPASLLQACDQNPAVLPATIPAFERLLTHNRSARIVWQHIGWDNLGQMTPELLGRVLSKHPNLYLAIKAIPNSMEDRGNRITDENLRVLPEWQKFIEAFQDRIVIGADEFVRSEGTRGGVKKPPFFKETWTMIQSLSPELAKKIGRENALRIYRLS